MSRGPLGSRLTCSCQTCLVWRRLGEEVHLGHNCQSFKDKASEYLRDAFNKLLEAREEHTSDIWQPLAEGTPGSEKESSEACQGSRKAPEQSKRSKRRGHSSSSGKKVRSPRRGEVERSSVKRSRSRRRRKSHRSPTVSVHSNRRHKRAENLAGSDKPTPVKEELTDAEQNRKNTITVKGEVSPVPRRRDPGGLSRPTSAVGPTATASGHRRPASPASHRGESTRPRNPSPTRGEEVPPGRWTLRERPAEPPHPPRSFRPPEPPGPPPGWAVRPDQAPRSKGVVRRERNLDILAYGPNPERKRLREASRR